MTRPTLLHLETALAVARIGTFSGAARKLDATQPAITARIRDLESSLGYRLFMRRGQRMELTLKGRQFIEEIEPHFHKINDILNQRESPVPANVRLGCGSLVISAWLGQVIGGMQSQNSRLRFQISIGVTAMLIPLLDQDKIDLAITAAKIDYPGLHTELLGRRLNGIWVTTPDRWKKFAAYTEAIEHPNLKDLINRGPVWTPPLNSQLYTEQREILRSHGADMQNINTCDDSRVLGDMIQHSSGLGFVQRVLVQSRLDAGELVEVEGLPPISSSDYYFVWRDANLSPIVHMLIKLAKAHPQATTPRG